MKSRGGAHEPGIRQAGAPDAAAAGGPALDALTARVAVLETAGGGKLYRLATVGGVDASGGDGGAGIPGLQGWTIVTATRFNRTDPGGNPSDVAQTFPGGIGGIFYNPIPQNTQITFKAGTDTSQYNFLLLVESAGGAGGGGGGGASQQAAIDQLTSTVQALVEGLTATNTNLGTTEARLHQQLIDKFAELSSTDTGSGASLVGFEGINRMWFIQDLTTAEAINHAGLMAHSAQDSADSLAPLTEAGALVDADQDILIADASQRNLLSALTADRTWTLKTVGAGPKETLRVLRRLPSLAGGHNLIIVNGGPGAGTLITLGPDAARVAEFVMNDAGTDWVLLRQARLVN